MSFAILLALALLASPAEAEPLAVGAPLALVGLTDQHDQAAGIDDDTRLVLFTRDMSASDAIKDALADEGAARLAAAGAVWVADISRMPRVITRFFAVPAMRKRPYRMILDRDGAATAEIPSESDRVTLLYLERRTVTRVAYAETAEAVARALEPTP